MTDLALTAVGTDRPGIVAALAGALFDLGCNIEDADSAVLRGVFAVTFVLSVPDDLDGPSLERAAGTVVERLGTTVSVRPSPGTPAAPRARPTGCELGEPTGPGSLRSCRGFLQTAV